MLISFLPLYYAAATYSALTVGQLRTSHARALGRAVAGHVEEARGYRSTETLTSLLQAEIGDDGVQAIGIYDRAGKLILPTGEQGLVALLPKFLPPDREQILKLVTPQGSAVGIVTSDERGPILTVIRTDQDAARVRPLVGLLGLYTAIVALGLLVAAYSALTRLIVQPLDTLGRAADRVISGSRRFEVLQRGPQEFVRLSNSLKTMTDQLVEEEQHLRRKVDEVQQAQRDLHQAQERLVRSERLASVGRLAAGLAHEVGNPLAALSAMQDLLLEGGLTAEEERDFLVRMRSETERIHRIIRDLLQFSRPAAHSAEEPPEPGSVTAAIEDTVALLAPQKAMRSIEVLVETGEPLPRVALGTEQLVQVLLNLLLNAADACAGNGTIVVRARFEHPTVVVEVEDTGPGVHPLVRQRLFEPFVTTKDVGEGTGLGLAVCRGLVEGQGGTLELDSSYASGARFRIELPAVGATSA